MSNLTCKDGILIPAAEVTPRNAVLYLAGLFYCFLGIAIAADIFMCAIEKITSATKRVKKSKEVGQLVSSTQTDEDNDDYEEVQVWNPTVANLTLMALGSSAPEILLSVIEIVGNGFKAGDLGPGTIVGSAAFNLFCISAICVMAVKSPGTKRIETFKVFIVTSFFAIFAYIWLLLVLVVFSPNVVEVWEAVLTLVFFVVLVVLAYAADVEIWKKKKANLEVELEAINDKTDNTLEANIKRYASNASLQADGSRLVGALPLPSMEQMRNLTKDISRAYPTLTPEDQAKVLAYRLKQSMKHDRLYYRIRAIRQISSSYNRTEQDYNAEHLMSQTGITQTDGRKKQTVEFSARVYAVEPHDKKVTLTIVRRGVCKNPITVNFQTVNGVAKRDLHYLYKTESVRFVPGERQKTIEVQLVEGSDWRPNHVFYVHLKIEDQESDDSTQLGQTSVARVRCPDNSASLMGEAAFEFARNNYVASESCGWVRVFVTRRGKVVNGFATLDYETSDVTAQENFDYVPVKNGKLEFTGQEYEKYIDIEIIDDKQDEKDETFSVELTSANSEEATIGKVKRTTVTIISDDNVLKNITNVRKLLNHYMRAMTPGQKTWKEQIVNAMSVNAGDIANATLVDCLLHALAFPWKFLLALVPPPSLLGGWLCFIVALAIIGVITAVVGDLASIFGCMVGMRDAITAITLVAIGTSLPDTFASKIAAENDENADNAIGNVTGSNSVNVFLGLGLPWVLAAVYWASKGEQFQVIAGDLTKSVTIFTICSVVFMVILLLRRTQAIFGRAELGGPVATKIACGIIFVLLWIVYVVLSATLN